MLVIPNTTTVATEQTAGFQSFPPDAGALTPFSAGYLFVANASAQVSIRKGPQAPGVWTPYALVSPTLIPLSTDRGGRKTPDYIWGVKALDAAAGTHAQIFGALFQAGEAGFVPSAQFGGTIAASGAFTPLVPQPVITGLVAAGGAIGGGTGFTVAKGGAGTYTVSFTLPFTSFAFPSVTAATSYAVAIVTAAAPTGFSVLMINFAGAAADNAFTFVASGA